MKFPEHTKAKSKQRKQIYLIIATITLIMVIIIGSFTTKLVKNGLNLRGMLMTSIGQEEQDIENLEPLYCLVMGISEDISTELTDTIMLCAYFPQEQKVSILSIPRDTFVGDDPNNTTSYDKINALYQTSPERTLQAVRELTGVDVRNYVVINNNALIKLIDAVGGIYFDVPIDMWYDDESQNLHIYLNKGYQLLNGENSVKVLRKVLRFRHNNDKSTYPKEYGEQDIGRMRTQREFIKAAAKQILSTSNILKLNKLLEIVFDNVQTNLSISDLIKYVPSATEFNTENMQTDALSGVADYLGVLSFFIVDEDDSEQKISSLFNLSIDEIHENKEKFEQERKTKKNTKTENTTNKNDDNNISTESTTDTEEITEITPPTIKETNSLVVNPGTKKNK